MRYTIILSVAFVWFNGYCFGQSYDTIAANRYGTLNQIDSDGNKQGLWLHYKMFFNSLCSGLSIEKSDTCFRQLSKGLYKNNLKTGNWEYYDDQGCAFSVERTENYSADGSVFEVKNWGTTNTTYNKDSTFVISTITPSKNDSVNIKCLNKDECIATVNGKVLFTFPYEKLDVKQFAIASFHYAREIRLLKE